MNGSRWPWPILAILVASSALAGDLDEFKVKREEVFEFAQKPAVTRSGDRVEIAFESKGFCDATVAIENSDGKIIRSGGKDLAVELEEKGYDWVKQEAGIA